VIGREPDQGTSSSPDAKIPDRVRLRIFERHGGGCQISGRKIRAGEPGECDHISTAQVQAAYRKLAAERHPNRLGSDAMMAELNAARDAARKERD